MRCVGRIYFRAQASLSLLWTHLLLLLHLADRHGPVAERGRQVRQAAACVRFLLPLLGSGHHPLCAAHADYACGRDCAASSSDAGAGGAGGGARNPAGAPSGPHCAAQEVHAQPAGRVFAQGRFPDAAAAAVVGVVWRPGALRRFGVQGLGGCGGCAVARNGAHGATQPRHWRAGPRGQRCSVGRHAECGHQLCGGSSARHQGTGHVLAVGASGSGGVPRVGRLDPP
mmetsp:Transcript_21993/g.70797  ORF Transcript_21993/g.70797 Transcript_21993/m.70797 type:complete len:227 (+) Transcript_21993:574-1254(+)